MLELPTPEVTHVLRTFRLEIAGGGHFVPRSGRVVQLEDGVNDWDENLA